MLSDLSLEGEIGILPESGANIEPNNVVVEECKVMEDINHSLALYGMSELF